MKLYCATTNPGKLREFRLAAARVRGQWEFVPLSGAPACEETGRTFEENAAQKAVHYSRFAPGLVFAEDSGLETNALGGAPGVWSARFAGPRASDEDNNRLLIERLRGASDRSARYVCEIALAEAGRLIAAFRGEVEGRITEEPRGANGFGYDPYFFCPELGRTFAEASPEEKLAVSHRGRAIERLLEFLKNFRAA